MDKKHIGSDFDNFLSENDLLETTEITAIKRVISYQIAELIKSEGLTKSEMASRMNTSRASLDRLLDPEYPSVTLQTLDKAARALNKQLRIEFA